MMHRRRYKKSFVGRKRKRYGQKRKDKRINSFRIARGGIRM